MALLQVSERGVERVPKPGMRHKNLALLRLEFVRHLPKMRRLLVFLLVLTCTVSAAEPPQTIRKICFLIHPLLYVDHSDDQLKGYYEYEKALEARWRKAIAKMGPDEALILWPITKSTRVDELVQYAKTTLGVRRIMMPRSKDWYGGGKLDQQQLAGIGQDLVDAMLARGETWPVDEMSQALTSWTYAKNIQTAFREQGLSFEPATVQSEAWGESFDGCVGKWSSFLARYLGFGNPVEVKFELSIPDARFLLDIEFLESIPLQKNVRLYLWRIRDGRLAGFYLAGLQRVADRTLYVALASSAIDLSRLEVQEKSGGKIWSGENNVLVQQNEGSLRVAVSRDLARRPGWKFCPGEPVYIFGKSINLETFRKTLIGASITE
jgi:hypothetical protein